MPCFNPKSTAQRLPLDFFLLEKLNKTFGVICNLNRLSLFIRADNVYLFFHMYEKKMRIDLNTTETAVAGSPMQFNKVLLNV